MPLLLAGGAATSALASCRVPAVGAAAVVVALGLALSAIIVGPVLMRGRNAGLLGLTGVGGVGVSSGPQENNLPKKPVLDDELAALVEPVEPVELVSAAATRVEELSLLNKLPKKPLFELFGLLAEAVEASLVEICGGSRPGCSGGTCRWPSLS